MLKEIYRAIYPNKCLFCKRALDDKRAFDCCVGGVAPYPYDDVTKVPIHALKYGGVKSLALPMARAMATIGDCSLLMPVPLHGGRLKERGFNQAALLAGELARLMKIPMVDGLVRIRDTAPQHGLKLEERVKNLEGAIAVKEGFGPENLAILLVDDIYTTGSTANECIRVLMEACAKSVDIAVFAKVK